MWIVYIKDYSRREFTYKVKMIRKSILVKGLVQGVGFRPYVYKIALKNNINGFIKKMRYYLPI